PFGRSTKGAGCATSIRPGRLTNDRMKRRAFITLIGSAAAWPNVPRRLPLAPLYRPGGWLFRVEGNQGTKGQAAICYRPEGRCDIRHRWHLGELEGASVRRLDQDVLPSSPPMPYVTSDGLMLGR